MPFDPEKFKALKQGFDPAKLAAAKGQLPPQDEKGNYVVQGPPNEPGLEQVVPITDPLKMGLQNLKDKSEAARMSPGGVPRPLGPLMKVGEAGLGLAQGLTPSTNTEVGATMAAGPIASEVSAVAKKALPAVGQFAAEAAGVWTGRDPEAIKALFKNPEIWSKVKNSLAEYDQLHTVNAIEDSVKQMGKKFRSIQDALAGFPGTRTAGQASSVNLKPALTSVMRDLERSGHALPAELTGYTSKIKVPRLDPSSSDYQAVTKFIGKVQKASKEGADFGEVLNLKRQLDDAVDYGIEGSQGIQKVGSEANRALKLLRSRVNLQLRAALPAEKRGEWDAANSTYAASRTALDQLRKEVVSATPHQTLARVMREMKAGRSEMSVMGRASKIGEGAMQALQDVHDRAVASQFHRLLDGSAGAAAAATTSSPRAAGFMAARSGMEAKQFEELARHALAAPQVLAAKLASHLDRKTVE